MVNYLSATLFWVFTLAFLPVLAQEERTELKRDSTKFLISADTAPEFPGGNEALLQFLVDNLKGVDLKDKPEGISILSFTVTKEGTIKDIKVIRSLEPSLDQAAIEAVQKMPRWIPGSYKGRIEDIRFTLPVRFNNSQSKKTKTNQKKIK